MKLLYKYLKEREGYEILETSDGLIMYKMLDNNVLYITDIYVTESKRQGKIATQLADKVVKMAKKVNNCTLVVGSVSADDINADRNIRVLFGYGMRFSHIIGNLMYFKKEV